MLLQGISELSTLKLRRNWRSSWLNKVVRKDGVRVPHLQLAEKVKHFKDDDQVYCLEPRSEDGEELWNLLLREMIVVG
ncbi:hypothetical protein Tco_0577802 [Tanacetum coccineum]